jgi:alkaline phosphatase
MRELKLRTLVLATSAALAATMAVSPVRANNSEAPSQGGNAPTAKNIILMVPDGLGMSYVTAARIFLNGPDGDPLYFETLPQIGYQRTHSANSTVTDSAAAGSAWATGEKFNNGEASCHSDGLTCLESPPTILELAKAEGKMTGLVATSTITHATPAVFGAHSHSRQCQAEIGRQLVEVTGVDVLLGGGIGGNRDGYNCEQYPGQDPNSVLALAQGLGYTYVMDEAAMNDAVAGGEEKILGLFTPGGKTPEMFRVDPEDTYPLGEPTLPEMTTAALDVLEESNKGFFLMVEGSQIDWAGHANDLDYLLAETVAFDEAVQVVQDWIAADPARDEQTLLIVVGDHETGGMMINGPYGELSEPGDKVEDGWTSGGHTAQDTPIWSQGPGSSLLGGALQNTDLFDAMESVLQTPLGDVDGNGAVDRNDVMAIRGYLRQAASSCPACDLDGDGVISVRDARLLSLEMRN